ncbi:MAG: undecaprenyl-diphosphate phosphatase [Lachnospiraceae bacterium]
MSIIEAIIMGLVQGLAEFLPISSSGHLAIFKQILHIEVETGLLFDVLLHLGTLVAIFVAFWKDVKALIYEGFCIIGDFFKNAFYAAANLFADKEHKRKYVPMAATPYRRFVLLVIVSTIPTGIIGVLFQDIIETAAAGILVPGIMLLVTGVLLLVADYAKSGNLTEANTSYPKALVLGIAQGAATLPGLSRSGTTIATGLLCGFDRSFAVRYSFIMSIPAVLGAALLEIKDFEPAMVASSELLAYLIGTVVAAVVGYISIKTMLVVVRGKKFKYFSFYCFFVGVIAIAAYFIM